MKMIRHTYEDPTGGGEDATLVLPSWAEAPDQIVVYAVEDTGERFEFERDYESAEEVEN